MILDEPPEATARLAALLGPDPDKPEPGTLGAVFYDARCNCVWTFAALMAAWAIVHPEYVGNDSDSDRVVRMIRTQDGAMQRARRTGRTGGRRSQALFRASKAA